MKKHKKRRNIARHLAVRCSIIPVLVLRGLAVLPIVGVVSCSDGNHTVQPRLPRSVLVKVDRTGDYPTIQAAIDASQSGDTIRLSNGRFRGDGNRDLYYKGRGLTIRSDSGDPTFCLIDCDGTSTEPHRGVTFVSGEDSGFVMEGITIEDGYGIGGGGAVRCDSNSAPVLRNMVFRYHHGTAVFSDGASPIIEGCVFRSNDGSALASHGGALDVSLSVFLDNIAQYAGGAVSTSSSDVTISRCIFSRNGAVFGGGALFATAIPGETTARVVIADCEFGDNIAGYHAGAVYFMNVEFEIFNCSFVGNAAATSGGAIWCKLWSTGRFENCLFFGNQGAKGAAFNIANSSVIVEEAIIVQNFGGPVAYCDTLTGPSTIDIRCSDIYGNDLGDWIGCIENQLNNDGNISSDPLFCNTENGDFRLQPGSPCVPGANCGLMGSESVGCNL